MVNLAKGEKKNLVQLAKDAGINPAALTELLFGLGWDMNKYDGQADADLDALVFMLGEDGKVLTQNHFIFYGSELREQIGVDADGKPKFKYFDPEKSIIHMGDNRTGAGDGDDEQIIVDLTKVPANCTKIVFAVTIYAATSRGQHFGMVENAYIRIDDKKTGTSLAKFDLSEDYSNIKALVTAELYRHNGEWKFNPVGAGYGNGFAALVQSYGITIDPDTIAQVN